MTPNDVNVNRKTIDAGGEDRRPQQRQRDLARRPPRRGAERGRRGLEVGRQLLPHGADGADDDGEVEQRRGRRGSPTTLRSSAAGSRASTAAPMTTVGSTKAAVSRPDSSRRPGKR